jgi:hypothetical protein
MSVMGISVEADRAEVVFTTFFYIPEEDESSYWMNSLR